ncbi:AIR synthase-related protein, partial [Blastococcus deserti]
SELASAGTGGMHIDLDTVPLRDSTLTPAEILMSESQERMCAIVEPGKVEEFLAVCRKWDVLATVIGEVTDGDRLTVDWHGERIVDVPPRTVAHEGPVYERPMARPADLDALQGDDPARLPRPVTGAELQAHWLAVISSPDGADKTWVTEQYDRYVRGNTVLAQPDDAGVVRIDEETHRGIALSLDGNARYARLDPYTGAQLNLAEAYRNVAVSGARPLAVTNCLNFGSPEEPEVMWQFAEAVRGLADACAELGLPVTGGNVSLYNQTGDVAINPTPVIGVLGVHDDVRRRVSSGWRTAGESVLLLGETKPEFGGSAWASVVHGHLGGRPPAVDLEAERKLGELLGALGREGLITSAHDLADGGLAQTLAESALRHGVGARLRLGGDPFTALFSESTARVVVTTRDPGGVRTTVQWTGVPVTELGTTAGSGPNAALVVEGLLELPLAELRAAWTATLPALFGGPEHSTPLTVPAGTVPTS